VHLGRELFVSLTLINTASKMTDARQGIQVAEMGAQTLLGQAERLNASLAEARV
jgi:hypothetical protein